MSRKGRASGYIIFASEYRKEATLKNPDLSFGEISRFVGEKVTKRAGCRVWLWSDHVRLKFSAHFFPWNDAWEVSPAALLPFNPSAARVPACRSSSLQEGMVLVQLCLFCGFNLPLSPTD